MHRRDAVDCSDNGFKGRAQVRKQGKNVKRKSKKEKIDQTQNRTGCLFHALPRVLVWSALEIVAHYSRWCLSLWSKETTSIGVYKGI